MSRLRLNAQAAARVCGISARQLTYWRSRGLLPADGKRAFSVRTLERAIAIRRLLDQGYTLKRAARLVREGQRREPELSSEELRQIAGERLGMLSARVRECRQAVLAKAFQQQSPNVSLPHLDDVQQWRLLAIQGGDIALRLHRAIDELAAALEDLAPIREEAAVP